MFFGKGKWDVVTCLEAEKEGGKEANQAKPSELGVK